MKTANSAVSAAACRRASPSRHHEPVPPGSPWLEGDGLEPYLIRRRAGQADAVMTTKPVSPMTSAM